MIKKKIKKFSNILVSLIRLDLANRAKVNDLSKLRKPLEAKLNIC